MAGSIIVLNGTSSAGKSTIATELQRCFTAERECWLIFGIDDFLPRLPVEWIGYFEQGPFAQDGVIFDPATNPPLHLGRFGRAVLAGYQESIAVMARNDLNVIVDEVVLDEQSWLGWMLALEGLRCYWVRVDCSPEICDQRERERGDRLVGLAQSQADVVHRHAQYDFAVDSGSTPATDAAQAIWSAYTGCA